MRKKRRESICVIHFVETTMASPKKPYRMVGISWKCTPDPFRHTVESCSCVMESLMANVGAEAFIRLKAKALSKPLKAMVWCFFNYILFSKNAISAAQRGALGAAQIRIQIWLLEI